MVEKGPRAPVASGVACLCLSKGCVDSFSLFHISCHSFFSSFSHRQKGHVTRQCLGRHFHNSH